MKQTESKKVVFQRMIYTIKVILSSIKRTIITQPYWVNLIETFRFFIAFKKNDLLRLPFTSFRYNQILFGIRPTDWYTMESILLREEYYLIKKVFSTIPPKIIIDAGANIGLFSVYALSNWPKAEVFAIEPSPETYEILLLNSKKNQTPNWYTYQYALWDKEDKVFFESNGLSIGWHISKQQTESYVPAIRLDTFINQNLPKGSRISLLKIDIEGAEEAMLTASSKILELVDTIIIEVHPNHCNEEVVLNTLRNEFPFLYNISTPINRFPIWIANRSPLEF